jgi:hypothetical protein
MEPTVVRHFISHALMLYKIRSCMFCAHTHTQSEGEGLLELHAMTPSLAERLLLRPFEGLRVCAVGPSEAVFIPQGWHHATLNLGETLSVGTQLPVSCERQAPPLPAAGAGVSPGAGGAAAITTALEAAFHGQRLHSLANDDGSEAIAYLQRAADIEVLPPPLHPHLTSMSCPRFYLHQLAFIT